MTGTIIEAVDGDAASEGYASAVSVSSNNGKFELIDMVDRRGMKLKIAIDRERNSFEECLAQERPDSGVTHVCELVLMDHGVLIDVGAHIGTVSIPLAKAGNSVFAFEMASENVEKLKAGRQANGLTSLSIEQLALSDRRGTVGFVGEGPWCSIVAGVQQRMCHCDTLDAFAAERRLLIDASDDILIKIDVEGHELAVILGAEGLLGMMRPSILYESILGLAADQAKATATHLRDRGYELYYVFEAVVTPVKNGYQEQFLANILAIPAERLPHILPRLKSGMELRDLSAAERLDPIKMAAFSTEVIDHPLHAIEVLKHWSCVDPELYEIASEIRLGLLDHRCDAVRSIAISSLSA